MPATNQDLKDFFAFTGNNPAVTNGQLQSVSDWLTEHKGLETPADADDLVDFLYESLRQQVVSFKRQNTVVTF